MRFFSIIVQLTSCHSIKLILSVSFALLPARILSAPLFVYTRTYLSPFFPRFNFLAFSLSLFSFFAFRSYKGRRQYFRLIKSSLNEAIYVHVHAYSYIFIMRLFKSFVEQSFFIRIFFLRRIL